MRAVHPLRVLTADEECALQGLAKAPSERVDVVRRARAILGVHAGQAYTHAAHAAGSQSGDSVSWLVERFNQQGLASLHIAAGRGRKAQYTVAERERILQELQRTPDRQADGTATWSLKTLERALRREALPQVSASTMRHDARGVARGGLSRWQDTPLVSDRHGRAQAPRRVGHRPGPQDAGKKRLIESAYRETEAGGVALWCQDEAGPYQAIPQPGETWHPADHPTPQPHEYVRGGTAKRLTLLRPGTGEVRAQGVLAAPTAVLHPWLKDQLSQVLAQLEAHPLPVRVPLSEDHLLVQTWQHGWWSYERPKPAPPLRLILVWDNLAGHLSYDLVRWLLQHGILPLYTPLSGSWLNRAESLQRILHRRALAGQHPQTALQLIDWLEQTVVGWNEHPTPFVWDGPRRRRRERARLRRQALGGSGAATLDGYSIPT